MDADAWLTDFLRQDPGWQLNGDELVLSAGATRLHLTDIRSAEPDRPLAGPRWSLQTVTDGDTAASVPAGAEAWLSFADGRVAGATSCARFEGAATAGAATITLAPPDTRALPCSPQLKAWARDVLELLRGELAYRITGDQLVLTGTDRRSLVWRATP
jgi:heat shock protein HslJ